MSRDAAAGWEERDAQTVRRGIAYANACVCNYRKTHYLDFPRDALVSGASSKGGMDLASRCSVLAGNVRGFFSATQSLASPQEEIARDRKRRILIFAHDSIERERDSRCRSFTFPSRINPKVTVICIHQAGHLN